MTRKKKPDRESNKEEIKNNVTKSQKKEKIRKIEKDKDEEVKAKNYNEKLSDIAACGDPYRK
uniref:Uncharacterized protein n=1 Tax=Romanomermis culicivorax TaxID=13658 RepID=A0A915I3S0_ROMCU